MRMSKSVVSSVLVLLLIAAFQSFMIAGPGADVFDSDTGISIDASAGESWAGIVCDDGPFMERIPAPYVVFSILSGAVVATVAFYLFVRLSNDGMRS